MRTRWRHGPRAWPLPAVSTSAACRARSCRSSRTSVSRRAISRISRSRTRTATTSATRISSAATLYIQEAGIRRRVWARFREKSVHRDDLRRAARQHRHNCAATTMCLAMDRSIISTPGHTPGHQSLLVRLPKRGPVILSGDIVHLQDNWEHRRVPAFNYNREQIVASMEKVAKFIASQKGRALDQSRSSAERAHCEVAAAHRIAEPSVEDHGLSVLIRVRRRTRRDAAGAAPFPREWGPHRARASDGRAPARDRRGDGTARRASRPRGNSPGANSGGLSDSSSASPAAGPCHSATAIARFKVLMGDGAMPSSIW